MRGSLDGLDFKSEKELVGTSGLLELFLGGSRSYC